MNYKHIAAVLSLCVLGAVQALAFDANLLMKKIEQANVQALTTAKQAEKKFVQLAPERKAEFDRLYWQAAGRAREIHRKHMSEVAKEYPEEAFTLKNLTWEYMGYMLEWEPEFLNDTDAWGHAETEQNERAIYYAVKVLFPAESIPENFYTKEFMEEHPVVDWELYRQQCQDAIDFVLQTLKYVVEDETTNIEYTVFKGWTH